MFERLLGWYPGPYPNPGVLPFNDRASLEELRDAWRGFLSSSRFAGEIGIYLHFPYCTRRCSYCDCSSEILQPGTNLDAYLSGMIAEMEYLAPVFGKKGFHRLYIGGGTPNLLTAAQMTRLNESIDGLFDLNPGSVRCVEFAPELTRADQLQSVVDCGFNRVSFGVQSLNQKVLDQVNRPAMNQEKALRAVTGAKNAGVEEINVDLIFGLADEPDDPFHRGLIEVLSWQPATVTIQLLSNSELARVYRSADHERQVARRFTDYAGRKVVGIEAENVDYRCHIRPRTLVLVRTNLKRNLQDHLDFYSSQDRVVVSTLAFGRYAQSKMHGRLQAQNTDRAGEFDPHRSSYVTRAYTEEMEAVMDAACELMNAGTTDLEAIRNLYGVLPRQFEETIDLLVGKGELERTGEILRGEPGQANPLLALIDEMAGGSLDSSADTKAGNRASFPVQLAGSAWTIHLEVLRPGSEYFATFGEFGIYYANHSSPNREDEEILTGLMEKITALLRSATVDHMSFDSLAGLVESFMRQNAGGNIFHAGE